MALERLEGAALRRGGGWFVHAHQGERNPIAPAGPRQNGGPPLGFQRSSADEPQVSRVCATPSPSNQPGLPTRNKTPSEKPRICPCTPAHGKCGLVLHRPAAITWPGQKPPQQGRRQGGWRKCVAPGLAPLGAGRSGLNSGLPSGSHLTGSQIPPQLHGPDHLSGPSPGVRGCSVLSRTERVCKAGGYLDRIASRAGNSRPGRAARPSSPV